MEELVKEQNIQLKRIGDLLEKIVTKNETASVNSRGRPKKSKRSPEELLELTTKDNWSQKETYNREELLAWAEAEGVKVTSSHKNEEIIENV